MDGNGAVMLPEHPWKRSFTGLAIEHILMLKCSEPLLLMLLMDFSKGFPPWNFPTWDTNGKKITVSVEGFGQSVTQFA